MRVRVNTITGFFAATAVMRVAKASPSLPSVPDITLVGGGLHRKTKTMNSAYFKREYGLLVSDILEGTNTDQVIARGFSSTLQSLLSVTVFPIKPSRISCCRLSPGLAELLLFEWTVPVAFLFMVYLNFSEI